MFLNHRKTTLYLYTTPKLKPYPEITLWTTESVQYSNLPQITFVKITYFKF